MKSNHNKYTSPLSYEDYIKKFGTEEQKEHYLKWKEGQKLTVDTRGKTDGDFRKFKFNYDKTTTKKTR